VGSVPPSHPFLGSHPIAAMPCAGHAALRIELPSLDRTLADTIGWLVRAGRLGYLGSPAGPPAVPEGFDGHRR
jgi:hypothetical protein